MRDLAPSLEERADAYLDGDLTRDDALAFEHDLVARPEAAEALAASLALRDLLLTLPPVAPPVGLADRLARALPLARGRRARTPTDPDASPLQAVLAGLAWTLRGTAVAAVGAAAPALPASAGMAQVRWALGPLGAASEKPPRPPRPLWRRLLFRKGRP
jgi:anti-sigma factor RsiW